MPEFERRGVRVAALSCNDSESHKAWIKDIEATDFAAGNKITYPIIADPGRSPCYDLAERCQARFNARVVERRTQTPRALSADLLIVDRD